MTKIKTNPNSLVGKAYDKDTYHCWHFLEEVLLVPILADVHVDTANDDLEKYIGLFKELEKPVNNCIVVLGESHIGIYFDNGIYHNDTGGVRYESLRSIKFRYKTFKYYEVKK